MDGGVFLMNTMSGTQIEAPMDLEYMDELLLEGCWLETADRSEFLHQGPFSSGLYDPSFMWSTFEATIGESSVSPIPNSTQEERQRSSFPENLSTSEPQGQTSGGAQSPPSQNMVNPAGYTDLSRRLWIGPKAAPGPASSVMERLIQALGYIKDSTRNKDALIQVWVPVNSGGKQVLSTSNQPFSLDLNIPSLASYREISVNYQFPTDENSKQIEGLPGRVFKGKVPEWTPDVRFFRSDEYARVSDAQRYGVCGTLAVPVFEQGSHNCLGVIEVVMTTQKANYRPELQSVCEALEAVDLRTSEVSDTANTKACIGSYQAALPEILKVLASACGTHGLPLAQTWVSCMQQGKGGCRHSDENYVHCVSTVDSACYVADPSIQGFHEACSEHHLLKGQGVAGRAFMINQPCFAPDITSFTKTEYPLSHHARMFSLRAAVAIRLRSIYTGTADFVLEFFLPTDCSDPQEQKDLLTSLSTIIQKVCWSLRVVTDKELEEESLPVDQVVIPQEGNPVGQVMPSRHRTYPEGSFWASGQSEVQESGNAIPLSRKATPKELSNEKSIKFTKHVEDSSFGASAVFGGNQSNVSESSFLNVVKIGEKRCTKAEKAISLQMLKQYFAGSLKDAAKSIGVCPTTLKRICRQHGIQRWPSRKLKKVGHSLQKLQHVIDSVQGASGTLQIESFYSKFPELASPKFLRTSPFVTTKPPDESKPLSVQHEGSAYNPNAASKSPSSSCSHSSNSSQCCSTASQPRPGMLNVVHSEHITVKETAGNGVLKRVRSEAGTHASVNGGKRFLPRSQSHKSLNEHPKSENVQPIPRHSDLKSHEVDIQALRIKVTYGEEKIRFRLQNHWGYKDLLGEISRRFGMAETNGFRLKYLDDDFEWVLLTCDADLEECIEVSRSSEGHTIKLSLVQVS